VLSRAGLPYSVTRVPTNLAVAVRVPAHKRTCFFITTSEPALKRPSHLVLYFSNKLALMPDADNSCSSQITECRSPACPPTLIFSHDPIFIDRYKLVIFLQRMKKAKKDLGSRPDFKRDSSSMRDNA
jgi:hypothetical protein